MLENCLQLVNCALVPVIVGSILFFLDRKTKFGKLNYAFKQIIIGIILGGCAILSTQHGVNFQGAIMNVRDSSPIIAALLFGAPSGIIAGTIGGVWRWFAVYFGAGTYTKIACSVSTIIAGFFAAWLKKNIFEKKIPSWFYGLATGMVIEVFHMLMIFLTNMSDIHTAFTFVEACSIPMITINSLAVMTAMLIANIIEPQKEKSKLKSDGSKKRKHLITNIFQTNLFVLVLLAYLLTSAFTFFIQYKITESDSTKILKLSMDDVKSEISSDFTLHDLESKQAYIVEIAKNHRIRESGFVLIFNSKLENISAPLGKENISIDDIKFDITNEKEHEIKISTNIANVNYLCMIDEVQGYYVVALLPMDEAVFSRDIAIYVNTFMEILVFAGLFILVYFLLKKSVVDNFYSVNDSLSKITKGNLNEKVSVYSNSEFSELSSGINETVDALKDHMEAEKNRLDAELKLAKSIQHSALPSVFPPYPNRKDFDVWASMDTAKEVGGDFYDIYMLDDNKIAFMIADVSGKGIPAAMFMMQSKTILKSLAETGVDIADVFDGANQGLCANNEAGMFVTAWMGIVDLTSGILTFVNAGHNPPLIRRAGGNFEFIKERSGMFLASFENAKYKKYEIKLEKGDEIFLYTDGVTESINSNKEMYGEARLQVLLNSMHGITSEEICQKVKDDVFRFAEGEEQFDDITMLYFRYN